MLRAVAAAALLIAFWWPATSIPYWQDDYEFLLSARDAHRDVDAREARLHDDAREPARAIWRPIGVGLWWRAIEGPLGGSARAAHVASLLALLLASAAVAWLATTIARLTACPAGPERFPGGCSGVPEARPLRAPRVRPGPAGSRQAVSGRAEEYRYTHLDTALVVFLLFGLHGAHFLPVAWASAANDSLAVLFGALALQGWVAGSTATRGSGALAMMASLACFAAALLSRESAVVLPLLGALLTFWLWPNRRPSRLAWVFGAAAIAITAAWWLLRAANTVPATPQYEMRLGVNVFRNIASLMLFLLNTPREALRFLIDAPSVAVAAWALACVLTQGAAVALVIREGASRLGPRAAIVLTAFVAVACSPFVLLAWNSYEYYVSFALMAYAIVAALAVGQSAGPGGRWSTSMRAAVLLAALSSGLFLVGNFALDQPALIARAQWGERQMRLLEAWREHEPRLTTGPLFIRVEDERRFLAMGASGLAYRLGVDRTLILPAPTNDAPPSGGLLLVVPSQGDVYWR